MDFSLEMKIVLFYLGFYIMIRWLLRKGEKDDL